MDKFEECEGIINVESLGVDAAMENDEYSPPEYMACTEEFELAAFSQIYSENLRCVEESPMEQETPDLLEGVHFIENFNDDPTDIEENKLERKVTFEENEISATSSKMSDSEQMEGEVSLEMKKTVVRRSSRVHKPKLSNEPGQLKSILKNSPKVTKRKYSEKPPQNRIDTPRVTRKRKSESSVVDNRSAKRSRSISAGRTAKSPKPEVANRRKAVAKRKSTGTVGGSR